MKYLKLSSAAPLTLSVAVGLLAMALPCLAVGSSEFDYFGSTIDYWHESAKDAHLSEEPKAPPASSTQPPPPGGEPAPGERFDWQKYLDPKNTEFFKEGDYTPPAPFMEIVRNPTDSNLKLWFSYIDKKNQLSDQLQARMKEYVAKKQGVLNDTGLDYLNTRIAAIHPTVPSAKRFRFRMYFDSHCPHCRRMFGTLTELQAKGFYVEARQVDSDPRGIENLPLPVQRVEPGELKEKDVQSVPLLLVGDLKKKAVYRLTGFQTVSSIFNALPKEE